MVNVNFDVKCKKENLVKYLPLTLHVSLCKYFAIFITFLYLPKLSFVLNLAALCCFKICHTTFDWSVSKKMLQQFFYIQGPGKKRGPPGFNLMIFDSYFTILVFTNHIFYQKTHISRII